MLRAVLLNAVLMCAGASLNAQSASPIIAQSTAQVAVSGPVLRRIISIDLSNEAIESALKQLGKAANTSIVYTRDVIPVGRKVTLSASNESLASILGRVLTDRSLRFDVSPTGDVVIARHSRQASARQGVIAGRVTDAKTGRGVSGANVSVGNDTRGVTTSEDGSYRLASVVAGTHTVTVRLLGYAKQTRSVTVGEGATVAIDFKLEPSANVLDQVVVTGTVVASELKSVPNAITVVTAKQIEERGITRIDQLFRGDIPGLFAINQGSFAPLDEVVMFSRGATGLQESGGSLSLTNPIKTYVDGIELANSKYLSQIDPKSIERIEILTGPQASTVYGSNAINGVMQIFTKRGTTSRPQLSLSLLSGWVENNFSSARTPQHDYNAQISGVEGKLSYNAGGSWNYMGPWTPAMQTARTGGFGGARLEVPTTLGRVTADMTLRRTTTQNRQRGGQAGHRETGWYQTVSAAGLTSPTTHNLTGQSLGLTLSYAPTSWWSHEFGMGQDASDAEQRYTARGYTSQSDTTLFFNQNHTDRRSLRYVTTARLPVVSFAQATVTAGADGWQNLTSSMSASPQTLTGPLTNVFSVNRQPRHNTGGFLQTQLGIKDRLFFTYGFRAEWHPDFGDDAQPNIAPRYGVAYTQEMGNLTAKLRGSYGRSTRPPSRSRKEAIPAELDANNLRRYDPFDTQLANPELGPEFQQGGEGGLELYWGSRGSLVVTRYNQTVDDLIANISGVDSVKSKITILEYYAPSGFDCPFLELNGLVCGGYFYDLQSQNLNVGSIRNQGWELQGSMNVGPITTRGTYSWTKSRMIGITPKFRSQFPLSRYQPGATIEFLPEHTWAFGVTYARAASSVGLNVTGTGQLRNRFNDLALNSLSSDIRLPQNRLRMLGMSSGYFSFNTGYAMADLTASHRFVPRVEGVLQVQNLTDFYENDYSSNGNVVMGRQLKVGVRIR